MLELKKIPDLDGKDILNILKSLQEFIKQKPNYPDNFGYWFDRCHYNDEFLNATNNKLQKQPILLCILARLIRINKLSNSESEEQNLYYFLGWILKQQKNISLQDSVDLAVSYQIHNYLKLLTEYNSINMQDYVLDKISDWLDDYEIDESVFDVIKFLTSRKLFHLGKANNEGLLPYHLVRCAKNHNKFIEFSNFIIEFLNKDYLKDLLRLTDGTNNSAFYYMNHYLIKDYVEKNINYIVRNFSKLKLDNNVVKEPKPDTAFWVRVLKKDIRSFKTDHIKDEILVLNKRNKKEQTKYSPSTLIVPGIPTSTFGSNVGILFNTSSSINSWYSGLKGEYLTDKWNSSEFDGNNLKWKNVGKKHQYQGKKTKYLAKKYIKLHKKNYIHKRTSKEIYEGIMSHYIAWNEGLFRYKVGHIFAIYVPEKFSGEQAYTALRFKRKLVENFPENKELKNLEFCSFTTLNYLKKISYEKLSVKAGNYISDNKKESKKKSSKKYNYQ